jgi:hypothetical protein
MNGKSGFVRCGLFVTPISHGTPAARQHRHLDNVPYSVKYIISEISATAVLIVSLTGGSFAQEADPSTSLPAHTIENLQLIGLVGAGTPDMDIPEASQPPGQQSKRMFGVLPNYATVEHPARIDPISAGQKFKMMSMNTFDPYVYPFIGFEAMLNDTYGSGGSAYLKQYLTSFTDNSTGNFFTTGVLPSLLHQDPRYFQRGSGRILGRVGYAASRSVITRGDSGHAQFNFSEIGGNAVAAGISNLYYPEHDRTLNDTLSRWGMQVMWDTLSSELKEFWPDFRRMLHHHENTATSN